MRRAGAGAARSVLAVAIAIVAVVLRGDAPGSSPAARAAQARSSPRSGARALRQEPPPGPR